MHQGAHSRAIPPSLTLHSFISSTTVLAQYASSLHKTASNSRRGILLSTFLHCDSTFHVHVHEYFINTPANTPDTYRTTTTPLLNERVWQYRIQLAHLPTQRSTLKKHIAACPDKQKCCLDLLYPKCSLPLQCWLHHKAGGEYNLQHYYWCYKRQRQLPNAELLLPNLRERLPIKRLRRHWTRLVFNISVGLATINTFSPPRQLLRLRLRLRLLHLGLRLLLITENCGIVRVTVRYPSILMQAVARLRKRHRKRRCGRPCVRGVAGACSSTGEAVGRRRVELPIISVAWIPIACGLTVRGVGVCGAEGGAIIVPKRISRPVSGARSTTGIEPLGSAGPWESCRYPAPNGRGGGAGKVVPGCPPCAVLLWLSTFNLHHFTIDLMRAHHNLVHHCVLLECYKPKSAGPLRLSIKHHHGIHHASEGFEVLPELRHHHTRCQTAHKNLVRFSWPAGPSMD